MIRCMLRGDPHIQTFDSSAGSKRYLDFMGMCEYVLFKKIGIDEHKFSITGKVGDRSQITPILQTSLTAPDAF